MENKELIDDINNNVSEYIRNIKENIDEKKNEIYAQKNCGVENIFMAL